MDARYRSTLVGYTLGFLDYYLKGFLNGGYFTEELLKTWPSTMNTASDYLRAMRKPMKRAGLGKLNYQTLGHRIDDSESASKYLSVFRIIGLLKGCAGDFDAVRVRSRNR